MGKENALSHDVAVGLVVVGGDAGAQPVSLPVAADRGVGNLSLGGESNARLAARHLELADVAGIGCLQRNTAERCRNIGCRGPGAIHRGKFDEAAGRREVNSLEVDSVRIFKHLLRVGLLLLDGAGDRDAVGLQVGDGTLQAGNRLGIGRDGLLLGGGRLLRCLRGRLSLLGCLLRRLELGITIGELLLQRVDLTTVGLLLLPQFLDLRFDARSFRYRLLVMDRLCRARGAGRGLRVTDGNCYGQRQGGERLQFVSHSASQELEVRER